MQITKPCGDKQQLYYEMVRGIFKLILLCSASALDHDTCNNIIIVAFNDEGAESDACHDSCWKVSRDATCTCSNAF